MMLDEVIDHRVATYAVPITDIYDEIWNGFKMRNSTTRGWEFLLNWKEGSTYWFAIKDIKGS